MNSINFVSALVFACLLIDINTASGCCKETQIQFLESATFANCEGKDAGNFTLISQFTRDSSCSLESTVISPNSQLLSCAASSRQTNVNALLVLASSINPNGAQVNRDILSLVTAGPLEGKYVYKRDVILEPQYLKICSSILGYSYVSSKSSTLLIGDKLDLNALISPTGAYEQFKKGCTTICNGNAIILGPTAIKK